MHRAGRRAADVHAWLAALLRCAVAAGAGGIGVELSVQPCQGETVCRDDNSQFGGRRRRAPAADLPRARPTWPSCSTPAPPLAASGLSTAPTAACALASAAGCRMTALHTSLAGFAPVPTAPGNTASRLTMRFHAEPIARPHWGPRPSLCDLNGSPVAGDALSHTGPAARRADCRHQGRAVFIWCATPTSRRRWLMLRAQTAGQPSAGSDGGAWPDSLTWPTSPRWRRWLNDPSRPVGGPSPARAGLDAFWLALPLGVGWVGAVLGCRHCITCCFTKPPVSPSGVDG